MTKKILALMVDDDVWFQRAFKARFEANFPDVAIELRSQPDVSGLFDLYVIDNQFNGVALAGELARRIREVHADALVIALSAALDPETLKALINEGCNGVCEKGNHAEMTRMFNVIRNYFKRVEGSDPRKRSPGVLSAIRSIADLLREWNARLDRQSAAEFALPPEAPVSSP